MSSSPVAEHPGRLHFLPSAKLLLVLNPGVSSLFVPFLIYNNCAR